MRAKEALDLIEQRLEAGHSRSDIYRELYPEIDSESDLLHYIAMVPTPSDRRKYRTTNLFLFWTLNIILALKAIWAIALLQFINAQTLASFVMIEWIEVAVPIFVVLLVFEVWRFRGWVYGIIRFLGVVDLLHNFMLLEKFQSYTSMIVGIWILFTLPTLLALLLAHKIAHHVFPSYTWRGLKAEKLGLSVEQGED